MEQASGIEALKVAVNLVKGQSALARVIGTSQGYVSDILKDRRDVPAEWCLPIEKATGGKVTRHQLRPDLYPDEARASAPPEVQESAA